MRYGHRSLELLAQFAPLFGGYELAFMLAVGVTAEREVLAALPVGAFEFRIMAFFLGQLHAGFNEQVVDVLIQVVIIGNGFVGFPADAFQRQQVVQTEGAETDRTILAVGILSLQNFNIVNVDDVIQHANLNWNETLQHTGRYSTSQVDGVQVADNEIARDFGNDDPGLAVFRNQLLLLNDGRRLVLHDLRAQVGRVDHAMSRVRVCTVDRVAVEHVRCTRFKLGFHDALHNVDGLYRNARRRQVRHGFSIL